MTGEGQNGNGDGISAGDGQGPRLDAARDRPQLPRRFYAEATVAPQGAGYTILLDGRPLRTPKKHGLALPGRGLAEAVAAEWRAQGTHIDPATMPMTRIANAAIDAVSGHMDEVAAEIVAFAGSDLLCYREVQDERLRQRQQAQWNAMLAWAEARLGARLVPTDGVMPVVQSQAALGAIACEVRGFDALSLSALHVMTTLTGSAVLALATALKAIRPEEAWAAAHVDEDFQIELWGTDAEAAARRMARWREFEAASRIVALLGD